MTMTFPDRLAFPQARKIVARQVFQAHVEAAAALPGSILNPGYLGEFQQTAQQEVGRKMEPEDGKVCLRQDYQRRSAAHRRV